MAVAAERKLRLPLGNPLLPLQTGDSMTSAEFLRRAESCHADQRVELIDGIVFMRPPLTTDHAAPDSTIGMWLSHYVAFTPGVEHFLNATLIIDADSTVQPDSILCTTPRADGPVSITPDRYLAGAPELVCEIATSSVSLDLHRKLHVYRRAGVKEYLVWRTRDEAFDWFVNRDGTFVRQEPDRAGLLSSEVFPGLALDHKALLAFDRAALLRCLDKALARRAKTRSKKR